MSTEEFLDQAATAQTPSPSRRYAPRFLVGAVLVGLLSAGLLLPVVGPMAVGARNAATTWEALPAQLPTDAPLPQRATLLDVDGKPFASLYGENRVPVTFEQLPKVLKDAVLSTEDARFYDHGPVNPKSAVRALLHNSSSDAVQGGSTITQQYVKNVLLTNAVTQKQREDVTSRTLARKLRELRFAAALEQRLSKNEILTGYLNIAYFGDQAYGVGAAAQHYFGTPVGDLTLPQAALLAGLLQDPNGYNPAKAPNAAKARRATVLERMVATGDITAAQAREANTAPLGLKVTASESGCTASRYPLYCEYVREVILTDPTFGATPQAREQFLFRGAFTVHTALDRKVTAAATAAARRALAPTNRVATAIAVEVPGTGAISALATNRRWGLDAKKGQTELVLPALPAYQPGSTFKAITLATALEQGFNVDATFDSPSPYSPPGLNSPVGGFRNDDHVGHGYINAYRATAASVNTWYVRLIARTGVKPVADMAERLGITSLPRKGPGAITRRSASLTLGSYEVSPVEMAAVYATFAANGVACRPTAILSMTSAAGDPIATPPANCHQAISPGVATAMTDVLHGPLGPGGTANGLGLTGRPSAGKTGTTSNNAAAWFVGYTPQYAAAVWVGDPRGPGHPLNNVTAYGRTYGTVFGATIPAPIWNDVMTTISAPLPVKKFRPPDPAVLAGATIRVPDVVGLARDAAITTLTAQGYTVRVSRATAAANAATTPGYVAAQTPARGRYGVYGATVTLTLTAGSDTNVRAPRPSPVPR